MDDPIRAAFFGNGFTRRVLLPCLREIAGIRAVALASPNRARARETAAEFGLEAVYADHRELLEKARPDLVFVTSPPSCHAEQTIDALEAGCHVVCEKPTALHAGESEAMRAMAAKHAGRIAVIDHELRFLPARRRLRQIVGDGDLGRILHVDYLLHTNFRRDPRQPWSWWSDRAQGGGVLGAIGSHAIDALRWMLGEIESVRGWMATFHRQRPDPKSATMREVTSDDFAAAWFRFRTGAMATMTLSAVEVERTHRITITGSDGVAKLDEQGPLQVHIGREFSTVDVPDPLPPEAAQRIPDTDWARAFALFAGELVTAIRAGATALPDAAGLDDGHRNQLVLDAIRESAGGSSGWRFLP